MFEIHSRVDVHRRTTVALLCGSVAGRSVELRRRLMALAEAAGPHLDVDLAAADDLDRGAVGTLLAVRDQLAMLGGGLSVTRMPFRASPAVLRELSAIELSAVELSAVELSGAAGAGQAPSVRSRTSA